MIGFYRIESEIEIFMEVFRVEFRILDRDEPISEKGRKRTIEEIRETVAGRDKNFKVSEYQGKVRVAIYRNGVKVAVVEFEGDVDEKEAVKRLKEEVLKGTFDRQLTEVYRKVMEERKRKVIKTLSN